MISQLTDGKTDYCQEAPYRHSLLDLDNEDDVLLDNDNDDSPSSWTESMFINNNTNEDTESRINFYTVPDSMKHAVNARSVRERSQTMQSTGSSMFHASDSVFLDTESRFGFYIQESIMGYSSNRSISRSFIDTTDSREDVTIVNDVEEPPSCRETVMSFADNEEEYDELDWLTTTTMKIEKKKKITMEEEQQQQNVLECDGIASNLRSFVTRCGSCFSPPL
jgi:hypothetical protein